MPEIPDRASAPDTLQVLTDGLDVLERQHLVRANLREIGADLAAAEAASDHDDWAATLEAVRLIQGRAVVARQAVENMVGSNGAPYVPPLVRAVGAVRRLISDREVDSLPPDELRGRMHTVLQALDRELQELLSPLDQR